MDAIREYLSTRRTDDLGECGALARAAMQNLQVIGRRVDEVLARCELTQGSETTDRHRIEETRQTLGGASREAWNAHESVRLVLFALAQLVEVEVRLRDAAATADALATEPQKE